MTTKERIYTYFARNQYLHVLFIFDPVGGFCDELEHEEWDENFVYHEFDGHSWFSLKYHLEHDWFDKKVVLLFRMLEPQNSASLLQFPVADLLEANAVYREDDYAEFIEQYGLPKTLEIQKFVSKHVADFRLKKFHDVLLPYFNRNDFTEDNDPYGEHDFGSFDYKGNKIFFKIDYYDLNYEFMSKNPANPDITNRVLSIMLAEEY